MAKVLCFTQIADSRFCDDIEIEIARIDDSLEKTFYPYYDIALRKSKPYEANFKDGTKQIRIDYCISKSGRKLTWNDVYKKINAIHPAPYKLV